MDIDIKKILQDIEVIEYKIRDLRDEHDALMEALFKYVKEQIVPHMQETFDWDVKAKLVSDYECPSCQEIVLKITGRISTDATVREKILKYNKVLKEARDFLEEHYPHVHRYISLSVNFEREEV